MTRLHSTLLGALGVQALLATATWWPRDTASVEAKPLVAIPSQDVTRIVIERSGEGAEPLELVNAAGGWSIASSAGYPAAADKVQALLETVLDIQVRRPIATKSINHDALHVGEGDWGKKLRLEAGEQSVELILGAASGQASHVRLAGQDAVYTARGLSEWSIKDRPSSYWDPEVVDLDLDSATDITVQTREGANIHLARGDGGWTFEGEVPEGEMIDPDKLDRLAAAACMLRLRGPVGTDPLPEHGLEPPAARVTVTMAQDDASQVYSYELGNTVDGQTYLQLPDNPFVVTVSEHSTEDLTRASVQGLLLGLGDDQGL